MLKLKKLQILGFKSFCDRTELKFHGDGVAAIVGPNGCGKSNIADAISWVLGEQSAKSLRGSRMEDVIFIGTRDRKPTGMAEVSLTLVDTEACSNPPGLAAEPQIDIQDNLDDWDEAALRAASAEATEQAIEELKPLPIEEAESLDGEPEAEEGQSAGQDGKHVILKIRRRRSRPMQLQAGEMVVTRRLFRSGESEYLLNGKICRLRDIQDIFMGTGLGPESYAIIEQGRIGQILSSKPHDRRAIIEEAAGVTKFKTRKRLAEARLEQSKLNLARINDIFDEVTRQMNSLKRQAAKAERYARLRDEMRGRLRVVLASKFTQMETQGNELNRELASVSELMRTKAEAAQHFEAEQTSHTQRGYALQEETRLNGERVNQIALELERNHARRHSNEERCAELDARSAASNAEVVRTRDQLANLQSELQSNQSVVESAAAEVASAKDEAAKMGEHARTAAEAVTRIEHEQEQRRNEILAAVASAAAVRNEIAKHEEHAAGLTRESDRYNNEKQAEQEKCIALRTQRSKCARDVESTSQLLAQVSEAITNCRQQLESKRYEEKEGKLRLDGLRAELAGAVGKRSSLESLIAEHGYTTESVKRLFQSGAIGTQFAPAGVLADFLEVEDRYESVVEDFLRDELNYVVVKSWDAADEGLHMLRTGIDGRATFLVHPEDAQAKFSFNFDESSRPKAHRDSIVPLKNCIRVLNGFGKSLEVILPKLGNGYIAPDAASARDMALENPGAFFLSPTGETFHNVTVTGGKQRSDGPLSMKRELRELLKNITELEKALTHEEVRVASIGQEIGELSARLETLESQKREAESQALACYHALQQVEGELQRAEQHLLTCETELSRIAAEREQVLASVREKQAQAAMHDERRQELELQFKSAQASIEQLRRSRDAAAQEASHASARVAGLEERSIAAIAALERINVLVIETRARADALVAQIEAFAAERVQRQTENQQIAEQLTKLEEERAQAQRRTQELQAESESLRTKLQALETEIRELRNQLDAARDRRAEISATLAKLQSDVEHLCESCRNELNLGRDELLADSSILRLEAEQLAAEEAAQHEMRSRLDAMGPVNMMALEEYKEVAERHSFLETQRKDLLDSIENTLASIKELDSVSRQKFEEAFGKINENFQFTFRKLFGGGNAFMRLTDEENSTESGIDIIASPPGKKLQNVLLLSGGEKALTALALLVGIFQYQPSPFCLLDEVDAPLDEANVGRFSDMIQELSANTQFVIITHNKRTMSMAPVLYGVTMQEPGVSKIVSVRFGEHARSA